MRRRVCLVGALTLAGCVVRPYARLFEFPSRPGWRACAAERLTSLGYRVSADTTAPLVARRDRTRLVVDPRLAGDSVRLRVTLPAGGDAAAVDSLAIYCSSLSLPDSAGAVIPG